MQWRGAVRQREAQRSDARHGEGTAWKREAKQWLGTATQGATSQSNSKAWHREARARHGKTTQGTRFLDLHQAD